MAQTSRTITRTVAAMYALTAITCMALAYSDVKDIYREDVYFSHWLGRAAPAYLWQELIFYGLLLIAPAAVLLLSSVGTFASGSRIRVFFASLGITLPFIVVICLPHAWGGRAVLYVAGPTASIMAALAYKRASYAKIAFWSSAALLATRCFILHSRLHSGLTPSLGSYVLWGEVEFTCVGLVLLCVAAAAIRLAYSWRTARNARKTFAA